jgi:nucleotide-binding universal stress UspA family protein
MLAFVAWKGTQPEVEAIDARASHIALSHGRATNDPNKFRVLLPIANPQNLEKLIELAATLAREKNGEIILLRVVIVPEQLPPTSYDEAVVEQEETFLKQARAIAERFEVPSHAVIRVGHDIARAILETARQHAVDMILLGWKGFSTNKEKILGSVTDAVVTHARTDIMLVKLMGEAKFQRILLPTAGGEHAQWAEQYSSTIVSQYGGNLTLCQVATSPTANGAPQLALDDAMARIRLHKPGVSVDSKLLSASSVSKGIVEESKSYDTVMLGAAGQSFNPKIMFGNIPEEVARETDKTVIVVKHYNRVKALYGRVMGE